MTTKSAFGLALTCALLLGCERERTAPAETAPSDSKQAAPVVPAPSEAQIKELLSRAAGMPGNMFRRIVESGGFPNAKDFPNHYLTLDLLCMTPDGAGPAKGAASPDFRMKMKAGPPNPSAFADALVGGRKLTRWLSYASVIWPNYVTELKTQRSGDEITGSAGFEAPDVYSGRVEFTLTPIRGGPGWKVTRLAMPGRNLALRLAEDGTWQPDAK